jgi:hypothetical protein
MGFTTITNPEIEQDVPVDFRRDSEVSGERRPS